MVDCMQAGFADRVNDASSERQKSLYHAEKRLSSNSEDFFVAVRGWFAVGSRPIKKKQKLGCGCRLAHDCSLASTTGRPPRRRLFLPGEYLTDPRLVWYHLYRDDIAANGKAVRSTMLFGVGAALPAGFFRRRTSPRLPVPPTATRPLTWACLTPARSFSLCSFMLLCRSCVLPCCLCPHGGGVSVYSIYEVRRCH